MRGYKYISIFCFICLGIPNLSCQNKKPFYSSTVKNWESTRLPKTQIAHTLFLVGDAGKPAYDPLEPSLALLEKNLKASDKKSTVIFLGDNIYRFGLPDSSDMEYRMEAEVSIKTQMDILKDYQGNIVFIPGNHDWNMSKEGGLERINRQEKFVEEYLNRGDVFKPSLGCPGPDEIFLTEDIVLLLVDSEWWLHNYEKPTTECGTADDFAFMQGMLEAIERNEGKTILLAMHHPFYSMGNHGGHYSLSQHLFPLRDINKKLYIPIPILGSLMPLYRSTLGHRQDIPNPRYRQLIDGVESMLLKEERTLHISGHEHGLQYFNKKSGHYVVSGSGCKSTHIAKGKKAEFTHQHKGFMKVLFYENGESWLEVWEPHENGIHGVLIFRQKLFSAN